MNQKYNITALAPNTSQSFCYLKIS